MLRSGPSEYHGQCWAPPITLLWELCLSPPRSLHSLSAALTLLTPCHLGSCGGGGAHLSQPLTPITQGTSALPPATPFSLAACSPVTHPTSAPPHNSVTIPSLRAPLPPPPVTLGPCSIRPETEQQWVVQALRGPPVPGHSSVAGPSGQPASSPEPLAGTWGRGPPLGPCTWQSGVHVPSVEHTPMGERDVGPRIPGVVEGGTCCVRTGSWETAGWTQSPFRTMAVGALREGRWLAST